MSDTQEPQAWSASMANRVMPISPSDEVKMKLLQVVSSQEQLAADVRTLVNMLPSEMTNPQSEALHRLINFILKQV